MKVDEPLLLWWHLTYILVYNTSVCKEFHFIDLKKINKKINKIKHQNRDLLTQR